MIKQIRFPLHGRPTLLITSMITNQIGLHSALLPLIIALEEKLHQVQLYESRSQQAVNISRYM